jgi:hypothetical protein
MPRNITVQFDDGSAHVYNNVPDSVSVDEVNARASKEFGKQIVSSPSEMHTGEVGLNAIYKGIGGGVDAILNAPTHLANLGIAAYGTAKGALGGKDLPEPMQTPDYARRGLESAGLIRKDIAPQSTTERIVDVAGQGAGNAILNPTASLPSLARNMGLGFISGAAGQSVREVAGDNQPIGEVGAALASIAAPMAASGLAGASRNQIARLLDEQSSSSAYDAIRRKGTESGFVTPPSEVNPSFFNKTLESVGGKAAMRQESEFRNQEVTNRLVKKQLGIPENQPITEQALKELRVKHSGPYKEVAELPPITTTEQVVAGINPVTNLPVTKFVKKTINPKSVLDELGDTRADAKDMWKAYGRDPKPQNRKDAIALDNKVKELEAQLEQVATSSGKSDLVDRLRDARKKIAQTYSAEDALNIGSTNIDALALARLRDRGIPLSGSMKDIAEFTLQNPKYMRESSGVPVPGVNALDATVAAAELSRGNVASGGLPFMRGPARAVALSKWYQKMFGEKNYTPSMMARMLKDFSPQEAQLAAARAAMLQAQQEQNK